MKNIFLNTAFAGLILTAGSLVNIANATKINVGVIYGGEAQGSGYRDNGYTTSMFSSVRQFLETGGGVITTSWYSHITDNYRGQQMIDADFITPIADA